MSEGSCPHPLSPCSSCSCSSSSLDAHLDPPSSSLPPPPGHLAVRLPSLDILRPSRPDPLESRAVAAPPRALPGGEAPILEVERVGTAGWVESFFMVEFSVPGRADGARDAIVDRIRILSPLRGKKTQHTRVREQRVVARPDAATQYETRARQELSAQYNARRSSIIGRGWAVRTTMVRSTTTVRSTIIRSRKSGLLWSDLLRPCLLLSGLLLSGLQRYLWAVSPPPSPEASAVRSISSPWYTAYTLGQYHPPTLYRNRTIAGGGRVAQYRAAHQLS
eukprot:2500937-Rhodomonas_salina.1